MNSQTQNFGAEPGLQPVILQSVCNPAAKGNVSIAATKCSGISQVIIGLLLLGVAIVFLALEDNDNRDYYNDYRFSGIAAIICGVLALIAGILGFQSFKYPKSYCKSGINVAFCILVCVAGSTCLGIYSAGIGIFNDKRCSRQWRQRCNNCYYNDRRYCCYWGYDSGRPCTKETALSAVLLVLAVIEFFVALAASIYGCQFACCGKEGCCRSSTKVMVMAYPNQLLGMTYPNHQTVLPFENPTNSEFPPPYCVNEQNCTNGSNENEVGQYQPM